MAVPTHVGKGSAETSPARYAAAVAAETMEVDAKSSKRRAAPARANVLVETFSL